MNPQRYIMPVIIAAGLHGALVFFFSDTKSSIICLKPEKPQILPDCCSVGDGPDDCRECG